MAKSPLRLRQYALLGVCRRVMFEGGPHPGVARIPGIFNENFAFFHISSVFVLKDHVDALAATIKRRAVGAIYKKWLEPVRMPAQAFAYLFSGRLRP